jgi:hypothetical protein
MVGHLARDGIQWCGESFIGEAHFGQLLPELQKIREDKIVAMLKEITLKTDEILSLAQQETQDIAALKAISQAVADKVRSAAQRMNDAIAALKAGTVNAQHPGQNAGVRSQWKSVEHLEQRRPWSSSILPPANSSTSLRIV